MLSRYSCYFQILKWLKTTNTIDIKIKSKFGTKKRHQDAHESLQPVSLKPPPCATESAQHLGAAQQSHDLAFPFELYPYSSTYHVSCCVALLAENSEIPLPLSPDLECWDLLILAMS